jgi:PIN domain nuclease of toxin-antitoxin system
MERFVFDASAVIALLRNEPGFDFVQARVGQASISAVNYQEAAKRLIDSGFATDEAAITLLELGLEIIPHDVEDAMLAASLAPVTRQFGRGLGDRSCMALAIRLGVPAVTTDKAWAQLDIPGLEVILAR